MIGKHKTKVWTEPAGVRSSRPVRIVKYHDTEVITATEPVNQTVNVTLDSGGYRTATTKRRINQALKEWGIGAKLAQSGGKWYVYIDAIDWAGCVAYPVVKKRTFEDGMQLSANAKEINGN